MNVNRLRKEKTSLGSPLSPLSRDRLPLGLLQSLVLLTIGFVVGRISNGHGNGNPSVATPKSPQNVALRSIPTTATMVPIETRSCDEEIDAAIANHVAATATATSDTTILQKAQNELDNNATVCDASTCRNTIFVTQGQGGIGELTKVKVEKACSDPLSYNVCQDLANFTGLSSDELQLRLNRTGRFHFEGEHLFWNPTSPTELAWYYSTSVDYLFANAIHPALSRLVHLGEHHQPVLDYSGGAGNSILYLALEKKFKCQYFGIGLMEKAFAEFRFRSRGLMGRRKPELQPQERRLVVVPDDTDANESLVTMIAPWSERTDWKFDPIEGPLPRDGSLGAIVAADVLEHIPKYHLVVEAMVQSLKVGGVIVENSPFSKTKSQDAVDTRVHLSSGGISMATAMGPTMKYNETVGWWVKISRLVYIVNTTFLNEC